MMNENREDSKAPQYLIEVRDVYFKAQHDTIVNGVSCCFLRGTATAITGETGSGKSTLLKLAAGILVPSGGAVLYKGADIAAMSRSANRQFHRESAFVFQDSALWANQTLRQILELPLSVHHPGSSAAEREALIGEALRAVGYQKELDIRPDKLSMGEQKLIGFARAILCQPQLLFLDEWTESLDDESSNRLIAMVRQFKAEQKTLVFITHQIELIKLLADTVLVMREGRLITE